MNVHRVKDEHKQFHQFEVRMSDRAGKLNEREKRNVRGIQALMPLQSSLDGNQQWSFSPITVRLD